MGKQETFENLEILREHFRYMPDTGEFYWLKDVGRKIKAGKRAGWRTSKRKPYRSLALKGNRYKEHRVAWAFTHGAWPTADIDHIDHDALNNRIENLRIAPDGENHRNKSLSKNNRSGHNGVHRRVLRTGRTQWIACIHVESKTVHLGSFRTKQEAIEARRAADTKYGFHANHGKQKTPSQRSL